MFTLIPKSKDRDSPPAQRLFVLIRGPKLHPSFRRKPESRGRTDPTGGDYYPSGPSTLTTRGPVPTRTTKVSVSSGAGLDSRCTMPLAT